MAVAICRSIACVETPALIADSADRRAFRTVSSSPVGSGRGVTNAKHSAQ